jgi:hypothetical protein
MIIGFCTSVRRAKLCHTYLAAQQSSTVASLSGIATTPGTVDYGDGRDEDVLAAEIHPLYGLAHEPPANPNA